MNITNEQIGIREAAEIIGVSRATMNRMALENFLLFDTEPSSGRYGYRYAFDISTVWDARIRYREYRKTENPCGKKPNYLRD